MFPGLQGPLLVWSEVRRYRSWFLMPCPGHAGTLSILLRFYGLASVGGLPSPGDLVPLVETPFTEVSLLFMRTRVPQ